MMSNITSMTRDELVREVIKLRAQKRDILNRYMNEKIRNEQEQRRHDTANAGYMQVNGGVVVWVRQ